MYSGMRKQVARSIELSKQLGGETCQGRVMISQSSKPNPAIESPLGREWDPLVTLLAGVQLGTSGDKPF